MDESNQKLVFTDAYTVAFNLFGEEEGRVVTHPVRLWEKIQTLSQEECTTNL